MCYDAKDAFKLTYFIEELELDEAVEDDASVEIAEAEKETPVEVK